MSSIKVVFYDDKLNIYIDDTYIGNIIYSINPYHNGHFYLKLQLQQYDTGVAKELFDLISKKLDKPLQIMILSEEKDVISFIQKAGFNCKRKCYEVDASVQDYIGKKTKEMLSFALVGDALYERCCEIIFDRYISTHKGINPWTGTKEEFFTLLPKTVFYEMDNETIRNLAFVEDNEIAYVYGEDKNKFVSFMQKLIIEMFEQNETIVFEADDCDEYAMELKRLFRNQTEGSFDTYIL